MQERVELNIAPSSLLILWSGAQTDSTELNTDMHPSILSLVPLTEVIDPERSEVAYRDGRVWVRLPYAHKEQPPSEA